MLLLIDLESHLCIDALQQPLALSDATLTAHSAQDCAIEQLSPILSNRCRCERQQWQAACIRQLQGAQLPIWWRAHLWQRQQRF